MPKLELLASSPGTGKTTYCIDLFRKEILQSPGGLDSRAYFVLPNREHAGRIQNLVLKKGAPGLFNVHILTFQDLAERFSPAHALPRPGESMRRLVLRRLLEDPSENWEYFAAVKELPGFYELLSERIQEFGQAVIPGEELLRRSKKASKDPVFRAKSGDFARLMLRYEKELALCGFSETPPADSLRFGPGEAPFILLDGFYHFTQAQKALIAALAKSGARMTAALTLPESGAKRAHVFELAESTRAFLTELGFKKSKAPLSKNWRVTEPALLHLERSIFLPRPGRLTGPQEAVKFITAETVHDEVEAIAREIRRLHRDSDWHFSDMALILRSVPGYEKAIAAVFQEYGIPVFVHERKKVVETGLGRFVSRLLELLLSDWQSADFFPLLKSGYRPFSSPAPVIAHLERLAFTRNIRAGRENWTALAAQTPWPEARGAVDALAELEKRLLESSSARIFRSRFMAFLRECPLEAASGDEEALRALEHLLARCEAMHTSAPAAAFSAVLFFDEFQRSIEAGLFSEKPTGKNRVQVYDAVMALPKEYRVVFIAGLLDQRFPQPVTEDPFFKDDERALLNGQTPLLELKSSRRLGERYFFYMSVTRAKNRLYLSYPRKDRDGRPYLPSVFVEEVRRCFTELPEIVSRPDLAPDTALWVAARQAEKATAAALFTRGAALPATEKKKILAYAFKQSTQRRFARVLSAGTHQAAAHLTDPRILEILKKASIFSPTRLEEYLTCAFKYFADHSLKLKPYLEDRLRAETGTMLHAVLEKYHGQKRSRPQLFEDLEKEFEKSPLAAEPLFRRLALLERAKRTLELFLCREKKDADERGFVPSHFELAFGRKRDGSRAELPYLALGEEGVQVGGFIDRVDVSPDGRQAIVIDYKLGQRDLRKKLEQGLEVQLPLYLLAAKKLMGLEPAGGELHFLESGKKAALPEDGLDMFLRRTEEHILEAARRIRLGDISIRSKSCDHCNFSTVCRYETWKQVYSEVNDG